MREFRCPVCRRLLFKGEIVRVQVKCPKCKKLVLLVPPCSSETFKEFKNT
ncbi:Com family DNA-binding transcriptional regulator [Maridesulfovibrio bastinii]|jgi:phage FluMu protein Com|nr:Com family DNA-binding transcriptional regulator [Maridesulfovibrio bastinii]